MTKTVAIVSGGMDSTTLAYWLAHRGHDLHLLSFDYGQRHRRELSFAERTAERLGARFDIVDLRGITHLLVGCSLTDADVEVPDGHYAEETMKATVVPNRNMMMLSVAGAVAVAEGAEWVATAVHAGDHFIYPDCRPQFVGSMTATLRIANLGFCDPGLQVYAPFVSSTKADIATIGDREGVPWAETWSCYKGGDVHCGACGTCTERIGAFIEAGVADPTEYADKDTGIALLRAAGDPV